MSTAFVWLRSSRRATQRSFQTMARNKGPKRLPTQKRPPLTHFLCVPLLNPESRPLLEASVKKFRDNLSGSTIHPKAMRPVGSLHLTLGVMSLDDDKLTEAKAYMRSDDLTALVARTIGGASKPEIPGSSNTTANSPSSEQVSLTPEKQRNSQPLEAQLKGLESMHASNKTSILYIEPKDDTGRLYSFCQALLRLFKVQGFLIEDNRPLTLHATVVNTIYAKGRKSRGPPKHERNRPINQRGDNESEQLNAGETGQSDPSESPAGRSDGHGPNADAPLKIDATRILEEYKNFIWADKLVIDRIAICEMGAKKVFDRDGKEIDAEYTEVASLPLST